MFAWIVVTLGSERRRKEKSEVIFLRGIRNRVRCLNLTKRHTFAQCASSKKSPPQPTRLQPPRLQSQFPQHSHRSEAAAKGRFVFVVLGRTTSLFKNSGGKEALPHQNSVSSKRTWSPTGTRKLITKQPSVQLHEIYKVLFPRIRNIDLARIFNSNPKRAEESIFALDPKMQRGEPSLVLVRKKAAFSSPGHSQMPFRRSHGCV